jgi:hypothetical protein
MIKRPTGWIAYCENCLRELSSNEIDECWPQDEDEFIKCLKDEGWCVDREGEVYCCEECMKKMKEDENE